jgi:hypothetical protein
MAKYKIESYRDKWGSVWFLLFEKRYVMWPLYDWIQINSFKTLAQAEAKIDALLSFRPFSKVYS